MISFWERFIDLLAPRACLACGERLTTQEKHCCFLCQTDMPRTGFEHSPIENASAELFYRLLPVEKCVSLFFYSSHGKLARVVEKFKYRHQPQVAVDLGRWMAEELMPTGFFEDIEVMVPVPLTKQRERQRGYNQAEKLAEGIREITSIPIDRHSVERIHFQKSQTHLGRIQRNENTEGAFRLKNAKTLSGKHVLLIDDIVTTGATLRACGSTIKEADGTTLSILTLALSKE